MKTQELIGLLAQDPMPAAPAPREQLAKPLLGATLACGLLVLAFWGLHPSCGNCCCTPLSSPRCCGSRR